MLNGRRVLFLDRRDAGYRLSSALLDCVSDSALVLGLARGGVVVAAAVARRLHADLDVLVVRKLGAPHSEELAIGAVTASSGLYLNRKLIGELAVPPRYLNEEIERQRLLARERQNRYRKAHPMPQVEGREVILVDDGLATGASMVAALHAVRGQNPASVVAAVPVGAAESCAKLQGEADDVVCLHQPEPFSAVGSFYRDFGEVSDEDVEDALDGVPKRQRAA